MSKLFRDIFLIMVTFSIGLFIIIAVLDLTTWPMFRKAILVCIGVMAIGGLWKEWFPCK